MNNNTDQKGKISWWLFTAFAGFIPFAVNFLALIVNGHSMSLSNLVLNSSDEVFWQVQSAAMVRYGMPLGYCGINGSAATAGTFYAWGIFPFPPYAVLGKIFGWTIYSRHIINLCFLSASIVAFVLLVNADLRQIALIGLTYLLLPVTIGYSLTSMNEPERYAFGIVIIGMLIRLYRYKCSAWFRYMIVPAFIIYSVFSYYMLAICIPIYIVLVLRDKKVWIKATASAAASAITVAAASYINGLTSAEYTVGTGPQLMVELLGGFKDGFLKCFWGIIYMCYRNLARFGFRNIRNISDRAHGFYSAYLGMFVILCFLLLGMIVYRLINRKSIITVATAAWLIYGFVFAYGCLYTDDEVTLVRGINCGLMMGLLVFIMGERNSHLWMVYYLLSIAMIVPSAGYIGDICNNAYEASLKAPVIISENRKISGQMKLDLEHKGWDNTVAYYGRLSTDYLEIPDGFGLNYMTENDIDERAGWAVVSKQDRVLSDELDKRLINDDYDLLYENEEFLIFHNKTLQNN